MLTILDFISRNMVLAISTSALVVILIAWISFQLLDKPQKKD